MMVGVGIPSLAFVPPGRPTAGWSSSPLPNQIPDSFLFVIFLFIPQIVKHLAKNFIYSAKTYNHPATHRIIQSLTISPIPLY